MNTLEGRRALVTGGSRGLGRGIVEALVARKALVTVLARDAARLAALEKELGVDVVAGDITDRPLAASLLRSVRPDVLVLNAGAMPSAAPLHEVTWEEFDTAWSTDVKGALVWLQESLRLPLARGGRVLLGSSGAAIAGSPLSGGYAGAKRMVWLLAHYANGIATERELGLRFQVLLPQQLVGDTQIGRRFGEAYARRKGVSTEAFLAGFGKPMPPRQYGEYVATILCDPQYDGVTAFGIKGESGISSLDG